VGSLHFCCCCTSTRCRVTERSVSITIDSLRFVLSFSGLCTVQLATGRHQALRERVWRNVNSVTRLHYSCWVVITSDTFGRCMSWVVHTSFRRRLITWLFSFYYQQSWVWAVSCNFEFEWASSRASAAVIFFVSRWSVSEWVSYLDWWTCLHWLVFTCE